MEGKHQFLSLTQYGPYLFFSQGLSLFSVGTVLLSQLHDFVLKRKLKKIEVSELRCGTNGCYLL